MTRIFKDGLTFDDVLLLPSYSTILPAAVDLSTQLTKEIKLNIPVISSAMDTVTESSLAIALAKEGGIGFIHKNMSIEKQVNEVIRVKRYESGIVTHPQCVSPETTLLEVKKLTKRNGFAGYPVIINGTNELVGIITSRDVRFANDLTVLVSSVMTPKERLVTVKEDESHESALVKMYEKRVEKVLIVDNNFRLVGMITVKDFEKAERKPSACKDDYGRLRVGAAVGVHFSTKDRVEKLIDAGVDVLLVDVSHGHSSSVLQHIWDIRSNFPNLPLIGGNVVTGAGAKALLESGVSAVKVGLGPGSICTTRIITGVGVPQITAIFDVVDALKGTDIPIIADGGVRSSGDIAKAIGAGASCVMIGSLLAGTEESPGEIEFYQGRAFKNYRGMGSISAMVCGSFDRYFQNNEQSNIDKLIPEGIEGRVAYKGKLKDVIHQLMGGVRASMGLTGAHTVCDLRCKSKFIRITPAGMRESHVHDVNITKESPNYHLG